MHCLNECNQTITGLIKAQHKNTRVFYSYFRVVFYGDLFGEEDGKEYVYRFSQKENLMTIQQYLKNVIAKSHNVEHEAIEVLGNQQVDRATLQENTAYLQIAAIFPYYETEVDTATVDAHFGIQKFLFESSFGKGEQQSKKKTIFETAGRFPAITTRLVVARTEEIRLTPLESAIDLIRDRTARFQAEMNVGSSDVRVNQLQQLLQGSVVPMVNEGPIKICETFLSVEERGNYPKEHIELLEMEMKKFINRCGFAVKLANQVIETRQLNEYLEFQKMIADHYNKMKEKLAPYLSTE